MYFLQPFPQLQQIGGVVSVRLLLKLIETLCGLERFCQRCFRFNVEALWTCRKRLVKILGAQLAMFDGVLARYLLCIRGCVLLIADDTRLEIIYQALAASGERCFAPGSGEQR